MSDETAPAQPAPAGEPRRVLMAMPAIDGRLEILTVMGLVQVMAASGGAVRPYFLTGNSNIHEARNVIAHYFKTLATDCDTLVMVDTDIGFDLEAFTLLMEGDEDIVIAPYAKKAIGKGSTDFGMGFCRIARKVFVELDSWLDEEGGEMLHRYYSDNGIMTDYFFTGASSDGRWFGEDTGFWHWCMLRGFTLRQEKRCRLIHVGKFYYCYPDQTPGLIPDIAGAQ
jgi:hypothetical protein